MSRADKYSLEQKKTEIYSDFLNNFDQNPITGALAKVTNEQAVAQALKNIVLTDIGERFYDSNKGSKIKQSLFQPFDQGQLEIVQIQLNEAINAYEPRALIRNIRVQDYIERNEVAVTIVFSIINIQDQVFQTTITVERVR